MSRVGPVNELLVWVDCEMTGLDLAHDALIEVAALVTDGELNVLGDGVDLVIKPSDAALDQMGDFVRTMHQGSGLLDRPRRRADHGRGRAAGSRLRPHASSRNRARHRSPATPSAPTGRSWPATCRPSSTTCTTATSTSPASRSWSAAGIPRVYYQAPAKSGNHRALADVQESIEELRYYREAVFVPPPGPDSADRPAGRPPPPGRPDRRRGPRASRGELISIYASCDRYTSRCAAASRPLTRRGAWWV